MTDVICKHRRDCASDCLVWVPLRGVVVGSQWSSTSRERTSRIRSNWRGRAALQSFETRHHHPLPSPRPPLSGNSYGKSPLPSLVSQPSTLSSKGPLPLDPSSSSVDKPPDYAGDHRDSSQGTESGISGRPDNKTATSDLVMSVMELEKTPAAAEAKEEELTTLKAELERKCEIVEDGIGRRKELEMDMTTLRADLARQGELLKDGEAKRRKLETDLASAGGQGAIEAEAKRSNWMIPLRESKAREQALEEKLCKVGKFSMAGKVLGELS